MTLLTFLFRVTSMSIRSILIAFIIVLLACLAGFTAGDSSVFAQVQSADSSAVAITSKRGDINLDGSLDIMDLLSILGKITGQLPQEPSDDLNGDGKVNIFDLLALLREMAALRDSGEQEFEAIVTIQGHLLCEPKVYIHGRNWDFRDEWSEGIRRTNYGIQANREIEKVEFILAGDTLYEISGTTPVLLVINPDTQLTVTGDYYRDYYVESELKDWLLRVWDHEGNCFTDSGQTRFSIIKKVIFDVGGSPNTGCQIQFPLVLHGPWQRFGLVHSIIDASKTDSLLKIDLNREGADSVVFGNIDQLSEAIMEEIVINLPIWGEGVFRLYPSYGPFASSAVSIHTELKTNRLLFKFDYPYNGGYISLTPLDGNEKLMAALGFLRWVREAGAINNNYKLDPEIFEKYKDRNKLP